MRFLTKPAKALAILVVMAAVLTPLGACAAGASQQHEGHVTEAESPTDATKAIGAVLDDFVPSTVAGAVLEVSESGATVYRESRGNLGVDSRIGIASASKMPSATAILTLVDAGRLALDTPITSYVGASAVPADKRSITLRMLLSHTSGLTDNDCLSKPSMLLAQCAKDILDSPLRDIPGTRFGYTGSGYQVAGWVATVITGRQWQDLFTDAVAQPLGLSGFTFGTGTNPRIAGGATSAAASSRGKRVLSESMIDEMQRDQVAGIPVSSSPYTRYDGYGFGWWIQQDDKTSGSKELVDPGALGYTPWIDLTLGYTAVVAQKDGSRAGLDMQDALRPAITRAVAAHGR